MERMLSKKTLQIGGLVVFFLFLIIYGIWGSHSLIFGVKIKNVDLKITENIMQFTGNAEKATSLILNGREISVNEAGDFDETLVLLSGYNIITLIAKDKFGYVDEKNYKLIN
jgi:hypothetical protein